MPYLYELFNINTLAEPPELEEYERCYRIRTGNEMDEVYAIVDLESTPEHIESEIRFNLVRRYGARFHGWELEGNYEDVTELYWGDAE